MLLWSQIAAAAALNSSLSLGGSVQSPSRHLGPGGMVGVQLSPRWSLEAAAEGRLSWEAPPLLSGRVEARLSHAQGSLLVGGGTGWALGGPPAPQVAIGLGLDSPAGTRTQVRYLYQTDGVAMVSAGVGVTWPRPPAVEAAAAAAPPTPAEPAGPTPEAVDVAARVGTSAEVMVWVPHPVCEWVSGQNAPALLSTLSSGQQVMVRANGFLPRSMHLDLSLIHI